MCRSPTRWPTPLPRRTSSVGVSLANLWIRPGNRSYSFAQTADTTAFAAQVPRSSWNQQFQPTGDPPRKAPKENKPPGKTTLQLPGAGKHLPGGHQRDRQKTTQRNRKTRRRQRPRREAAVRPQLLAGVVAGRPKPPAQLHSVIPHGIRSDAWGKDGRPILTPAA